MKQDEKEHRRKRGAYILWAVIMVAGGIGWLAGVVKGKRNGDIKREEGD